MTFPDPMANFIPVTTRPSDGQLASASVAQSLYDGRFYRADEFTIGNREIQEFLSSFDTTSPQRLTTTSLESPEVINAWPQSLDIPMALRQQSEANAAPWSPSPMTQGGGNLVFRMEELGAQPARTPVTPTTTSSPGARSSASPVAPFVKQEKGTRSSSAAALSSSAPARKGKSSHDDKSRVNKHRSPTGSASSLSSSAGSSGCAELPLKFITYCSEMAGKSGAPGNMFECIDKMTQRGRKGPLADSTKENALIVRRLGACFCCHARKVKCDTERPCRNCIKLTSAVPQIVCWQFQDFLGILFPSMLRDHFTKDRMADFIATNVRAFLVNGEERVCTVELTSGQRLQATLMVQGRGFTPETLDVEGHWRQETGPMSSVALHCGAAVPIGLDTADTTGSQKEELRKRIREYISKLVREPAFAEETTASIRSTELPGKVLRIVQTYALRSQSDIAKRALTIYANHYVLSRHLTLTANALAKLTREGLASQHDDIQTPRLLNRQIKALLDELNQREMQLVFEAFSKSLKPKIRKEWAPCMAAFLVLTLFMEELEVTLDTFSVSQNEINRRRGLAFQFKRHEVLGMTREIENMPFKQFAYQFHQIYQTHSTDASSKPFNPFLDESLLGDPHLDPAAIEMVMSLKKLMFDAETYGELDFLSGQGDSLEHLSLDNGEAKHPVSLNLSTLYSGRLMAKFLLSFTGIQYLLDP